MSRRHEPAPTSAASEGPEWSARPTAWAESWGEFALPAFEAVADATGIGASTRLSHRRRENCASG